MWVISFLHGFSIRYSTSERLIRLRCTKSFAATALVILGLNVNRFDFDLELFAKLVRKGFQPCEIGVRYNSRSFEEGKKVSVLCRSADVDTGRH